ncbi:UDP-N-acetylglucosamine 2-epimerase [Desulfovibrio mangrovi]|uniref:UDP-N-acetylglucosamine 2-epimerase n=1 Tax=Desulfovibrio mangrovi TaxID=2976983 RepID=UPI0022476BE8|nr:UDP-N-acetylglucosamine 2-epimerase [Desulfovibrio mangrovi]UZP66753.1 UDP-N-acetylglucosamine 2-epimerase [Desulfovibrio mangrovi]
MRKICIVTGTRADYGLLRPVMRHVEEHGAFSLQIIATGMHLSHEFGNTAQRILDDGFRIDERVEMLLSSDTAVGITKSMGLGVIGFADAFARLAPDLIILLGDRFEILAATQAALIARIPVAHLCGGDITEGAFDESIRHAITKMSHIHFVSNAEAAARVRQMGENPERIFNVGSSGIDAMFEKPFYTRNELEEQLGMVLRKRLILATYHPETLGHISCADQLAELLAALDAYYATDADCSILFSMPNADTGGRQLMRLIGEYAMERDHVSAHTSLDHRLYVSAMKAAAVVVGNSSSGLYEAPSLRVPSVNIGDRQKGRLRAASVIDCEASGDAILTAIRKALSMDCSSVVNPYGSGNTARLIVESLASIPDFSALIRKPFHMVAGA